MDQIKNIPMLRWECDIIIYQITLLSTQTFPHKVSLKWIEWTKVGWNGPNEQKRTEIDQNRPNLTKMDQIDWNWTNWP